MSFNQNLISLYCYIFADGVKNLNGKILVHCHAGISRSATVCLAYIMFTAKIGLEKAFEHVQSRRSVISPNLNFMRQLKLFEKELGYSGTGTPSAAGLSSTGSSLSSCGSYPSSSSMSDSTSMFEGDNTSTNRSAASHTASAFEYPQCSTPAADKSKTTSSTFDFSVTLTSSYPSSTTTLLSPS